MEQGMRSEAKRNCTMERDHSPLSIEVKGQDINAI
jgi:hypothetical protein